MAVVLVEISASMFWMGFQAGISERIVMLTLVFSSVHEFELRKRLSTICLIGS